MYASKSKEGRRARRPRKEPEKILVARSEVSGGLGRERLDASRVTVLAQDVSIQRVTALVVTLRQQRAAVLYPKTRTTLACYHILA